ncbi:MAG: TerC/Alx family metal homeostasis membrane protein [Gammaproteobacteria bacterium]|nr:MAG: TerC/Alx family metal homeostasis membrane protein [Gammaproteobacteria bacterium]
MHDVTNIGVWIGFSLFLIIALSLDTFVLHRSSRTDAPSMRTALCWTLIWIGTALIFNVLIWFFNPQKALEFFAGYLIEKSLSIDNLFAFYMIFHQFRIPAAYQQRIFSIGIWSAIILRLLLILGGTWLVTHFHWMLYLMGAFLVLTGLKMGLMHEKEKDLTETSLIHFMKRFMRITHEIHGNHFFIRKDAKLYATGLFLALVFIEISDIVFAFDSIPAIFAVTMDPFIVWSSNIFAILGLRALYFLLAGMVTRFHLLKYGIALILIFVGSKMLIEPWVHVSVLVSLSVIIGILLLFTYLSMRELACSPSKPPSTKPNKSAN